MAKRGLPRSQNRRLLKLGKFFGNSAHFWLGIQHDYDLEAESKAISEELQNIQKFNSLATI